MRSNRVLPAVHDRFDRALVTLGDRGHCGVEAEGSGRRSSTAMKSTK